MLLLPAAVTVLSAAALFSALGNGWSKPLTFFSLLLLGLDLSMEGRPVSVLAFSVLLLLVPLGLLLRSLLLIAEVPSVVNALLQLFCTPCSSGCASVLLPACCCCCNPPGWSLRSSVAM